MRALGLSFGYREFMSYRPTEQLEIQLLRDAGRSEERR